MESPYSPKAEEKLEAYLEDFKIDLGREAERRARNDEMVLEMHVDRARQALDVRSHSSRWVEAAKVVGPLILGFCLDSLATASDAGVPSYVVVLAAVGGGLLVYGLLRRG
jgi:hypothetical protein